jgi:hypothetical protein
MSVALLEICFVHLENPALGCESIGFMDDYEKHEVLLAFTHRGRNIQLRVSAKGWGAGLFEGKPVDILTSIHAPGLRAGCPSQGRIAVNSILRDWIKGQVTAVECGILSFEAVFMPFMLTHDGRPLLERVSDLLPQPDEPKVVEFKGPV